MSVMEGKEDIIKEAKEKVPKTYLVCVIRTILLLMLGHGSHKYFPNNSKFGCCCYSIGELLFLAPCSDRKFRPNAPSPSYSVCGWLQLYMDKHSVLFENKRLDHSNVMHTVFYYAIIVSHVNFVEYFIFTV